MSSSIEIVKVARQLKPKRTTMQLALHGSVMRGICDVMEAGVRCVQERMVLC